jgi:hypothetical protein
MAAPAASAAAAAASARKSTVASAGPCRISCARAAEALIIPLIRTPAASSAGRTRASAPGASHTCWLA